MTEQLRGIALDVLLEADESGSYVSRVLKDALEKYACLPKRDRAFVSRLVEGTVEYRIRLDYVIDRFSSVPVRKQKPVIREILRSGVYQLLFMDSVPASAVCNEAVKLAAKKGFHGLKGFVNGVLRNISRNLEQIGYPLEDIHPVQALSVQYSMPEWIVEDWLQAYGLPAVKTMLAASLEAGPMTVRCRSAKGTAEECIKLLAAEGVLTRRHPYLPYALTISGFDRLDRLDTFCRGYFTVQDVSSMLVGEIAAPPKDAVVLDVCAAPGGKSLHIADLMKGTGRVYARDISSRKLERIRENAERLAVKNLEIQAYDACRLDPDLVEKADVVLADLPCSGLGVMGKKKDIKYRMSRQQQKELAALQQKILDTVWQYVKPGGVLIYSTCTVSPLENERMVEWFLEKYPFRAESLTPYLCEELAGEPTAEKGYLQLLPGIHLCDGFFLARLRKNG